MNYGIKTLPATGGLAVATIWGQLSIAALVLGIVILLALAIRFFWRRGKGPHQ